MVGLAVGSEGASVGYGVGGVTVGTMLAGASDGLRFGGGGQNSVEQGGRGDDVGWFPGTVLLGLRYVFTGRLTSSIFSPR